VVCAAAVEEGSRRRETIEWVLGAVAKLDPYQRTDAAWDALFDFAEPTPGELCDLLRCSPQVSERVAKSAFAALDRQVSTRVAGEVLDALALLDRAGRLPIQQRLHELIGQDAQLRDWCTAVANGRRPGGRVMHMVSKVVLDARSDLLLDRLLDQLSLADALAVVEEGGPRLPSVLADRLPEVWEHGPAGHRRHAALALAFLAATTDPFDEETAARLDQRIVSWLRTTEPSEVDAVERVLRGMRENDATDWRAFAEGKRVEYPSLEPAEKHSRWRLGWRKGG
jgi:hypothetical protein